MANLKNFIEHPYYSIVFMVLSAVVPLLINYIFEKNRPAKCIGFSFRKFSSVYDGVKCKNQYFLVISSVGRLAIEKNDFDLPLKFIFAERLNDVNCSVFRTEPNNIFPKIIFRPKEILIDKLLLNPGDKIIIKIESDYIVCSPGVAYRIANSNVFYLDDSSFICRIGKSSLVLSVINFMSLLSFAFLNGDDDIFSADNLLFTGFVFTVAILFISFVIFARNKTKSVCSREFFDEYSEYYQGGYLNNVATAVVVALFGFVLLVAGIFVFIAAFDRASFEFNFVNILSCVINFVISLGIIAFGVSLLTESYIYFNSKK